MVKANVKANLKAKKNSQEELKGRPRKYDQEAIAIDLVEWAKKEDSTNLNGYTVHSGIIPRYITRWAGEDESFRRAYEEAKAILAYRREKLLTAGELHVKAYDLNAKVYDHFLREESREEKVFDSKLKIDDKNDESASRIADAIEKIASKPKGE